MPRRRTKGPGLGATGRVDRDELEFVASLTPDDAMRVGQVFLNAVAAAVSLGHDSPNGLMEYVARPGEDDPMARIVWDAFAATRFGDDRADDAVDELIRFTWRTGIAHDVAEAMAVGDAGSRRC
jgi:hypothetical protein